MFDVPCRLMLALQWKIKASLMRETEMFRLLQNMSQLKCSYKMNVKTFGKS